MLNKLLKLKAPSKWQVFKYLLLLLVVASATSLIYYRGIAMKDCYMASYDLKRDTDFRVLTGACTTMGKDGSLIYVNQLRGFGTDDISHEMQ